MPLPGFAALNPGYGLQLFFTPAISALRLPGHATELTRRLCGCTASFVASNAYRNHRGKRNRWSHGFRLAAGPSTPSYPSTFSARTPPNPQLKIAPHARLAPPPSHAGRLVA